MDTISHFRNTAPVSAFAKQMLCHTLIARKIRPVYVFVFIYGPPRECV